MKRVLKFLIPLTLTAALVVVAAWFFLSFRADLTSSFCLQRAINAAAAGQNSRAIRWYDYALSLDPKNSRIAIDLASAYARNGNYTKAEYTLVGAITTDPDNLAPYLELCKVYVAQDKLLDAEQLLSRTANEQIRLQLEQLRPAPPTLSPEGGSYSELIQVSMSYHGGLPCLSLDGDFPSLQKDAYEGPVTIEPGETIVKAVVVSEDGLVSTPVSATYLIGGIVEEVSFQDAFVSRAVHEVLDKAANDVIMSNELWGLTTLELPSDTQDLSDLIPCTSLSSLTLQNAYGVDLTVLSQLTGLRSLDLSGCTISSGALSAVTSLPNLTELRLSGCAITDLSPLSAMTTLEVLDLSNNAISDITPLSSLTSLRELNLSINMLSSIAALSTASNLEMLDISSNRVATLAPLDDKTKLTALRAPENRLTDVSVLSSCPALKMIDISNNQVEDISPLAGLAELGTLQADHNQIAAIPDFSKVVSLNRISLNYNDVRDVEGLRGLTYLNYVSVDYNRVKDLSPLEDCLTLVQVDAFANEVADSVGNLIESEVIVNYDPTYKAPPEEEESEEEEGEEGDEETAES